jgi:PBSX family phage portal protein
VPYRIIGVLNRANIGETVVDFNRKKEGSSMSEDKPFGGANVVYIHSNVQKMAGRHEAKIKKESAQAAEESSSERIWHPAHDTNGDLIEFWGALADFNSYHARCLSVKARCAVGLGITIEGQDPKAVREKLSIVNDLGQSLIEVVERVALDYEATGNGYLEIVRNNGGKVSELYHIPSRYVWRKPRGGETAFLYEEDTTRTDYPAFKPGARDPHSVIQFANPTNLSRYYGAPEWRGAAGDIELDYYAVLYNQKFFINSGVPDMAIVVEGAKLDEDDKATLLAYFQNNIKGVNNAHRVLYVPIEAEGVKLRFEKLAMEQKDKDGSFDKLRARVRDNVVSAQGVPPRLVGIMTAGQLGGGGEVEGQLRIFQETMIAPRQMLFETKLEPVVVDMGFSSGVRFSEMSTTAPEAASTLVSAGILTVDEARENMGLGPKQEIAPPPDEDPLEIVKGLRIVKSAWDRQEVA